MLACGIFAALSGSSPATAAAIGGMGIPEMRKRGYSAALATGLIAHAGTFGILIPPSMTMILYGVATETSIGKCFIAGVVPGLLEILLSCVWIVGVLLYRIKVPAKEGAVYYIERTSVDERYSWSDKFASLIKVIPFVLLIFGIMGALYGGWATPSEAGGVGAVLSLLFTIIIYRVYKPKQLMGIFSHTMQLSSELLMIVAGSVIFSYVCSDLYITQSLALMILNLPLGKWGIIVVINILLIILGLFIPPVPVILMVGPLLLPVVTGLGFDPVWFAVIMTVNLEIGLVTPPVGVNLYVVNSVAPDVPLRKILLGVVPFVIIELIVIAAVCVWPELALWLPSKMS
jgi:tripartite ATP-independent transporter DctM subunit